MKRRIMLLAAFGVVALVAIGAQRMQAPTRVSAASGQGWTTVSDDYYGYSFELPAGWHREDGVTPDRRASWGDPVSLLGDAQLTQARSGLMKVEFSADPVGHWLPDPEVRDPLVDTRGNGTREDLIPLLPEGTWTKVGGQPALILSNLPTDGGDGPFATATSVFILAEHTVYHLWIGFAPPPTADKAAHAEFADAADRAAARILSTFAVVPGR